MNIRKLCLFINLLALPLCLSGLAHAKGDPNIDVALQCDTSETPTPCLDGPVVAKGIKTWKDMLSQILVSVDSSTSLNGITARVSGQRIVTLLNTDLRILLAVFEKSAPHKLVASIDLFSTGGVARGGQNFDLKSAIPVSPRSLLIWLVSVHENSDESFVDHQLLLAEGTNLKTVYDGPFLYSVRSGAAVSFSADIQALPLSAGGYPDFQITVGEHKGYANKKNLQVYRWTISWDPHLGKYMGGSKDLVKRMKALNPGLVN